ncbi:MAG: hypothetical protein RL722_1402, partial [Pseudomonadota bacterium]
AGGTKPVATAVVSAGKVVGINVTTPGKGYSAAPLVSITGGGGTGAKATSSGFVDAIKVDIPFPDKPTIFGGGGYIDLDANSTNPDITPITYTFTGGNGTGATATATGRVFNVSLTHPGSGYAANEVPTVTLGTPPSGVGSVQATATANAVSSNYLVKNKGIQELFDPTYGRLNATFSTELPFTSGLVQTTIPLAFVDAPTEMFADGETQIWKITHNGVDTHPVHFHLLNVQLINRVSWDGFIMPPDANELGWKETVRMNPLEDIIVAVKAKRPPLPGFGVPDSIRPMDPSQPLDSPYGFSQIDPSTGMPAVVTNQLYNFGWEYTWHCHILGHEENDFMRPWQFDAKDLLVKAPALGGVSVNGDGSRTVSWTDATPYGAVASLTDSSAEVGFRVQRSINGGSFADVATGLTNVRGLNKPGSGLPGVPALVNTLANATSYIDSLPIVVPVPDALAAPTPSTIATNAVTLGWSLAANAPATSFNVMRQVAGSGAFDQIGTLARVAGTTSYSFDDTTAQPGASYVYRVDAVVGASGATASVTYQVVAVNVKGEAASGASAAMDLPATGGGTTAGVESAAVNTPPMAPTFTGTGLLLNSTTSATVSWAAAQGAASYQVRYCQAIAATGETCTMGAWNAVTGATSYTATGLTAGSYVQFEVQALSAANAASASAFAPSATTRSFLGLPGTAAATVASRTASSIVLNLSASNATGYQIKVAASDAALATAAWQNVTGSSYTITGTTSTQYFYQVQALNNGLIGTASAAANAWTLATAVAAAPTVSNLANTSLTLNWVGTGASSYTVQRATNATFTQGLSTTGNLTGTSLNVSGLTANRTYYFRVVAVNGGGNTSAASPTLTQVTLGTAPTTVSARNGQAGGTVSGGLNFRGGVATRYEIRWANNNAMTGATLISTGVTSGTLYTLPVAASNVANVWMQVRAVNSAGVAGDWAPVAPVGVIAR